MAIWLPQMGGGKKIRDADALPEDVRLGRVFYNNEGRQVGNYETTTLDALKKIYTNLKSFSHIPYNDETESSGYFEGKLLDFSNGTTSSYKFSYAIESTSIKGLKFETVVGIELDGNVLPCSFVSADYLIGVKYDGVAYPVFYLNQGGCLWKATGTTGGGNKLNKKITAYYI